MRILILGAIACVLAAGCGKSDSEVKEAAGNAAVNVKHAAENTGAKIKEAYDQAAIKGKELAGEASKTWSDGVLKTKVITGFKVVKDLDSSHISVDAKDGVVYLSGTVPTELDKAKAEGVAYGVTGDQTKVQSTLTVSSQR